MTSFSAKIYIIGINPYVLVPANILKKIFEEAGKSKGPIPIKGTLNGNNFTQTLVKFSGKWRLYLNTPMRNVAGIDVGDSGIFKIAFDAEPRLTEMHPKLQKALNQNKIALSAYEKLSPYRQKEVARYINNLKTPASVEKNVEKAITYLCGKGRFAGRDPEL